MKLQFVRRITQRRYLRELEDEYGSLEKLAVQAKKDPSRRALLEEWKHFLAHPERADEILTVGRRLVFHDPEAFLRAVSPQRLRLYDYLRSHPEVESLNDLANRLKRNYRNVYEDAAQLAKTGIITLERHTNRVVPRVLVDAIQIEV